VAAAIIAAMVALLCQIIGSNALVMHGVQDRREAALIARSVLAEASASHRAVAGTDGGWAWRTQRERYDRGTHGGTPLWRVTVTVENVASRRVAFRLSGLELER